MGNGAFWSKNVSNKHVPKCEGRVEQPKFTRVGVCMGTYCHIRKSTLTYKLYIIIYYYLLFICHKTHIIMK